MENISKSQMVSRMSIIKDSLEIIVTKFSNSILLLFFFQTITSQQLPQFSQYNFNAFLLNPAVAGAEGYTAINLTTRAQWIGVEGAPRTGTVSIQTRIMKRNYVESNAPVRKKYLRPLRSGRVGLAGGIYFDRAGLIDQTSAFFTYAYHLTTNKSQFSLGTTVSLLQFKVNTDVLSGTDLQNSTSTIGNNNLLVYLPDFNVGAYFTNEKMFVGLSVLQLAQGSVHFQNNSNNNFILYRHFYLTGGYKFELNGETVLEPSFYLKTSEQLRMQMDATLKLIYEKRLWVGLAYRTGATFIASVGMRVDRLYFGYAFDYGRKGLLNNSYGSHELMVALKLGDNVRRYKWIERY